MQLKRVLKSAFAVRNLALLAGVVIVTYFTEYLPFMFIGAAGYVYFVLQSLKDGALNKEYSDEEKIDNLRELSSQCNDLYDETRKVIDKQFIKKLKSILQFKDELMDLFIKDKNNFIKQKVIEQAIKLVMAYINLMSNYSQSHREVVLFDTNAVMDTINANERKIRFLEDFQAIEDLKHAIEMDRELLEKISQEKKELERTGAKLTYIESTLKTFKHQIVSSENTDGTVTDIENIINEATALDNVLNDDNRNEKLKQ